MNSWSTLSQPVPHSLGLDRPARRLPPMACDCHMHIFDPRFKPSPHWTRQPPLAPVAAYRRLQERLGTTRAIVVTPSTYGTDNRCTLDALAQLGSDARGVAMVDPYVSEAELDELASRGIRGLRLNFVTPQSWGVTTPDLLITLASKGSSAQAFRLLMPLLEAGSTWIKLSGAYMRSSVGGPSYADTVPLGQALVRAAPHRILWGSDWPHTTETAGTVNDAALVDLLQAWCGDDASLMDRILVDNPAKLYGFAT